MYKKDLHDPDNHDGVITHLEPHILECEVKWALGSITTNKASGGDGISWSPTDLGGSSSNVIVVFSFSDCSWWSQGKNTEVVLHSLLWDWKEN